ncbi:MAG: DUF1905 domain-containing protein [Pseudomonadota bacterium]
MPSELSDTITATLPLRKWVGDRGTYHLVVFEGADAEALTVHARLHRLEFGRQRGFGSVKLTARIGETEWNTSVFPQAKQTEWVLLVSKKVMHSEHLGEGDEVTVKLKL